MPTLPRWYCTIYNFGLDQVPKVDHARHRAINLLCAVVIVLTLGYCSLYFLVFQSDEALALNLLCLLGYLCYFMLVSQHRVNAARRVLVMVYLFQMLSFMVWVLPKESGLHLYCMAGVPVAFLLFNDREHWQRLSVVVASLTIFFVAELIPTERLLGNLSSDIFRFMYLSVVPIVSILVALTLWTFSNEIYKRDLDLLALSLTDPLTTLTNRRGFMERAQEIRAYSLRVRQTLCVIMVDIDHFKCINDSYGHAAGDSVLAAVAKVLRQNVRLEDAVGRIGGEEFAVLLTNSSLQSGLLSAELLRQRVADIRVSHCGVWDLSCTISLGVAELIDEHSELDEALDRADKALYRAKTEGRNRVCSG
jgi:diguanylate cyclase (GGDEF)-like protein